jgi:poly-gamma-glutamate synthesis protein (capsule biosynthesis protein)
VGTDIIELTGNHMLDYGVAAMNLTLQMYEDKGWTYYAGGWDLADSQTPRLITHNGNSLAFLGCNPVGPTSDFATDSQPGSAPCGDYAWLLEAIAEVRGEGYLPIVTLQYNEDYTDIPSAQMMADFQSLVDAGAVVVNGSQAHTPKIMTFYKEGFIHYGLGNLFFDQMEVYYGETYMPNTRDEFIDRLVFYDNQLVSVELLTAELEDYARPRPMTEAERAAFLSRIFNAVENYLE